MDIIILMYDYKGKYFFRVIGLSDWKYMVKEWVSYFKSNVSRKFF